MRRWLAPYFAVLCLAAASLFLTVFASAPASAALTHPYVSSFGSFSSVQGMAVDSTSGDVYVYDGGEGEVLKFDASGNPVNFTETGTNSISGVGSASGGEGELAVDNSPGPAKGDIYVAHADGTINIYSAAGAKLGELTSEVGDPWGEACGVAVDASGDVYVGLYSENVNKYVPSANPVTNANFASSMAGLNSVCNVAVDSAGNVFADSWSSGPLTRYEPGQFGSLSASGSVVDGAGSTVAVDPANDEVYVDEKNQISQFGPHGEPFEAPVITFADSGSGAISQSTGIALSGFNHDVYVSDGKGAISVFGPAVVLPEVSTGTASNVHATTVTLSGTVNPDGIALTECKFEYGTTTAYGENAPCAETVGSGTSPVPVHADLSTLASGASYHYKLVAANTNGSSEGRDQEFATPGAPVVSGESFSNVAGGEAVLSAQIDPNYAATTYHVEYGTTGSYGHATVESEPVGSDNTNHAVSVHLAGLVSGATYHFRFVATNSVGPTNGSDTVLVTYLAPAPSGGCSNEQRREEQDSTFLPDCRAYEMVSPLDKNGGDVVGNGQMVEVSTDGDRASFASWTGFGNTAGSGAAGWTQYVASREEGKGWTAHGITPTPARDSFQIAAGVTASLLFSEDLSRAVTSGYDLPEAEDDIPKAGNYYVENTETLGLETVTKPLGSEALGFFAVEASLKGASNDLGVVTFETESNLLPEAMGNEPKLYAWEHNILKIAGVLPDGNLPAGGSRAAHPGSFTWLENRGTVSRDGSRVAFLSPASGPEEPQLYLRRNGAITAWVSQSEASTPNPEPHGVIFQALSPEGNKVLFTTSDKLLDSDPGGASLGLYMYTDSPNPEAEPNLTFIARIDGGNYPASSVIGMSEDAKRIYFFTGKVPGFTREGIYLWDEGTIHFVAAAKNAPERMLQADVSPDGRTFAFIDSEQATGQPVPGQTQEMYLYDETGETLHCVSCLPTGAPTTFEVAHEPDATVTGITLNTGFRPRFLSSNGRYVFFSTAAPLVAQDTNGLVDAYEFDVASGQVSLLSTGTGDYGAWVAGSGSRGDDVFLLTQQPLLRGDTDTLVDLYDVRVDGGFPGPKPETGGCAGDECQGTPSAAPGFNTASGFTGLGNVKPVTQKAVVKKKTKPLTRAQKLAKALKACKRKPKRARRGCDAKARTRYGVKKVDKSQARRARR